MSVRHSDSTGTPGATVGTALRMSAIAGFPVLLGGVLGVIVVFSMDFLVARSLIEGSALDQLWLLYNRLYPGGTLLLVAGLTAPLLAELRYRVNVHFRGRSLSQLFHERRAGRFAGCITLTATALYVVSRALTPDFSPQLASAIMAVITLISGSLLAYLYGMRLAIHGLRAVGVTVGYTLVLVLLVGIGARFELWEYDVMIHLFY